MLSQSAADNGLIAYNAPPDGIHRMRFKVFSALTAVCSSPIIGLLKIPGKNVIIIHNIPFGLLHVILLHRGKYGKQTWFETEQAQYASDLL